MGRASAKHQMRLIWQGHVIGELSLSFEQQVVFQAANLFAAAEFCAAGIDLDGFLEDCVHEVIVVGLNPSV